MPWNSSSSFRTKVGLSRPGAPQTGVIIGFGRHPSENGAPLSNDKIAPTCAILSLVDTKRVNHAPKNP
ncbi:MAG: hypothetical protein K0U65_10155, partial [Gammaproteobacteria bacterium]|nr:hypothetical protein [Gammaproteobacteria bacterium]